MGITGASDPAARRPIAVTSDRCDMRTRVPLADDADTCPSDGVGKGSDHGNVNASSCPIASTDKRDTKAKQAIYNKNQKNV